MTAPDTPTTARSRPAPGGGWWTEAVCSSRVVDPEWFFPLDENGQHRPEHTARALAVCRACPVRAACLADALAWETPGERHGIVGGTTPAQRDRLHPDGRILLPLPPVPHPIPAERGGEAA